VLEVKFFPLRRLRSSYITREFTMKVIFWRFSEGIGSSGRPRSQHYGYCAPDVSTERRLLYDCGNMFFPARLRVFQLFHGEGLLRAAKCSGIDPSRGVRFCVFFPPSRAPTSIAGFFSYLMSLPSFFGGARVVSSPFFDGLHSFRWERSRYITEGWCYPKAAGREVGKEERVNRSHLVSKV